MRRAVSLRLRKTRRLDIFRPGIEGLEDRLYLGEVWGLSSVLGDTPALPMSGVGVSAPEITSHTRYRRTSPRYLRSRRATASGTNRVRHRPTSTWFPGGEGRRAPRQSMRPPRVRRRLHVWNNWLPRIDREWNGRTPRARICSGWMTCSVLRRSPRRAGPTRRCPRPLRSRKRCPTLEPLEPQCLGLSRGPRTMARSRPA